MRSAAAPTTMLTPSPLAGNIVASRRLAYIYINNPKCGCSTVRQTLWAAEHALGLADAPGSIHTEPDSWPWVDDSQRWEHNEQAFVFTLVRNPYARVLSAYLDKIRDPNVWEPFAARHGLGDTQVSFIEFLRLIADEPPDQMDMHWRPQSHIVAPRVVPYDFIGTMESFEQDLWHILKCIFRREMPISVLRPHRTDAVERLAEYGPERSTELFLQLTQQFQRLHIILINAADQHLHTCRFILSK